jgi:phosphatidylglycerol:prolipoprotein diacylglycerol transferase
MSVLAAGWAVGLATPYTLLVAGGLVASAVWWGWMVRVRGGDVRLPVIYGCGLVGAILGAKIAFVLAEGWKYRGDAGALLTGKSITGALLAGYVGVEVGKRLLDYRRVTGDLFALVVPLGIAVGRIGCMVQGCCPGSACEPAWWTVVGRDGLARWPAAHVEWAFNVVFLAWAIVATRRGWFRGNRFHLYLMAYGTFRFANEFARDNARVVGPLGVYHGLAAALAILGAWGFVVRLRRMRTTPGEPCV